MMNNLLDRLQEISIKLRITEKLQKIAEIEQGSANPSFWQDREKSSAKMKELAQMTKQLSRVEEIRQLIEKNEREKAEKELGVEYRERDQLLGESDYITLHVPLTAETRHLINAESLSKVRPTAYLINTARGAVIDEHALVEALRAGKLAGVALDVHENEPQMNPELMQMENAILTPHIASATYAVREKMAEQAVDSILKTLKGEKPENLVNPEVWGKRRSQVDISSRTFSSK